MKKITALLIQSLLMLPIGAFAAIEPLTFVSKHYAMKHPTGLVRSKESKMFLTNAPRESFQFNVESVPGKYSLRGKAGPVEDQGMCGSCWDFSLTSVLRGTWIQQGQDPGRLSFNYLLNCAATMWGCDGGDFSAADYLVSPKGAPPYGSDGSYTASQSQCKEVPPVASTVSYKLLGTNLGNIPDAPLPSFKDIAYVVGVLHQPVSIDVAVDDAWQSYSHGVFNKCNSTEQLNHMVSIEGYSCETSVDSKGNCVFDENGNLPKGVGTWIIRNSWGTSWGDNGYITMKATDKKGNRCSSVATDALYFNVK
jgi:C1A family cysteine protease